jgi:diacylglycerol kinase (ATP)
MTRRFIYLINPISGTRAKSSLRDLIKLKTRAQKIDFELLPTNEAGDYHYLVKKIRKEKVTDIIVCGGDGSVSPVASALQGVNVAIGIVPMGSGNGLAFSANIPRQPSKALDIVFQGKSVPVDAFLINGQFSCMLCGIGFDALVAHEFAKQKRRGLQTYIKTTLIQFFKAAPYRFEIQLPGKSFLSEAFFISIANSNQFGNNFTIAPQASLSDGLLDIVIVKKMSKLMLPFSMISQVTGINAAQPAQEYADKRNITYFQTDSITIKNLDFAPLHIDGEPRETSGVFKIGILRNCFRLLQPAQ